MALATKYKIHFLNNDFIHCGGKGVPIILLYHLVGQHVCVKTKS